MNKAILFDFDGVIVDSEKAWEKYEPIGLKKLFGEIVFNKISEFIKPGANMKMFYEKACEFGFDMEFSEFEIEYGKIANEVYANSNFSKNFFGFYNLIKEIGFRAAMVTSAPESAEGKIKERFKVDKLFDYVLFVNNHDELNAKPAPDGYLEALKVLGIKAENSLVIEDSSAGIQAGKSAGIVTICLKQNHIENYVVEGADIYVESFKDLIKLFKLLI